MQVIDWNVMSAPWLKSEKGFEAIHQGVLDGVMKRAGLKVGQSALDIGFGTGASLLAAAAAVGETGHVTGVDIAPPLAARAQERTPEHVAVRVGDAGTMAHDQTYDAAISLFGTMFFADTAAAFANIRKALKPGAKFVFAAWGPPPQNPWFGIPRRAVEAHVGPLPKPDPAAPGPFRFADAQTTVSVISSAGWDVAADTEALTLQTGQDPAGLADMHLSVAEVAMLANHDLTDGDRDAIRKNLADGFTHLDGADGVQVPAVVHFFTATAVG